MGRWTPLILMAGGLAILLGTLLGINFPMDGRNAEAPSKRRESQVLPANINVNSTATNGASGSSGQSSSNNVAQNNNNSDTVQSAPTTTAQGSSSSTGSTNAQSSSSSNSQSQTSGNKAPIRALW